MNLSQYANASVQDSQDEYVLGIRRVLKRYKLFFSKNGNRHNWDFTPTKVLDGIMREKISMHSSEPNICYTECNQIYHDDIESDIEALKHIYVFRINALLETCISLINKKDYLSAAIIARSLLELAAVSLHHSYLIEANYKKFAAEMPDDALKTGPSDLPFVREILERGIWGTRLPDLLENNADGKQFNVIGILKKVADKEKTEYLQPLYDFLCEATHPNLMGNYQFIKTPKNTGFNERVHIVIDQPQTGDATIALLERTLGAISWSALVAMQSYDHFQNAISIKKSLFIKKNHLKKV